MYHRYFGLTEAPFSISVDPRYLFLSARHSDALAHLLYGVGSGGGFVLLSGEVGTGKTMLVRCLLEKLPSSTDVAMVLNPTLNAIELLATICDELHINYPPGTESLKVYTDKLHRYLLDNHKKGRNTVLLIDEAQHLQIAVLEQIRLLTNLETHNRKLLQIILVGQPELEQMLAQSNLRQLAQRITARYQLKPLNLAETAAYIDHRLKVAGLAQSQQLFSPEVINAVYSFSGGIPRLINVLCERLLVGCYGLRKKTIDRELVRLAIAEVRTEEAVKEFRNVRIWLAAVACVLIVAAIGLLAFFSGHGDPKIEPALAARERITTKPEPETTVTKPVSDDIVANAPTTAKLALQQLLTAMDLLPTSVSCDEWRQDDWRCQSAHAQSWDELLQTNRPTIIELITASRFRRFVAVWEISGDEAIVIVDRKRMNVPLQTLGLWWTGNYQFIWQTIPGYSGLLKKGDRGPAVIWIAEAFAELDQQAVALTRTKYNEALAERVRLFQRSQQLHPDGVIGINTLLKINEALGRARVLQIGADNLPDSSPEVERLNTTEDD